MLLAIRPLRHHKVHLCNWWRSATTAFASATTALSAVTTLFWRSSQERANPSTFSASYLYITARIALVLCPKNVFLTLFYVEIKDIINILIICTFAEDGSLLDRERFTLSFRKRVASGGKTYDRRKGDISSIPSPQSKLAPKRLGLRNTVPRNNLGWKR